jgi:hypothetical protein
VTGWLGGLQIRRTDGGLAIADFLCTSCWLHRRATGQQAVTDLLTSDPITQHQDVCPAREDRP